MDLDGKVFNHIDFIHQANLRKKYTNHTIQQNTKNRLQLLKLCWDVFERFYTGRSLCKSKYLSKFKRSFLEQQSHEVTFKEYQYYEFTCTNSVVNWTLFEYFQVKIEFKQLWKKLFKGKTTFGRPHRINDVAHEDLRNYETNFYRLNRWAIFNYLHHLKPTCENYFILTYISNTLTKYFITPHL